MSHREYSIGTSDYFTHEIQPWDIIWEYRLDYWEGTMLAYLLRKKAGDSKAMDYKKIQHNAQEVLNRIGYYVIQADVLRHRSVPKISRKDIVKEYGLDSVQSELLSLILTRSGVENRMKSIIGVCNNLISLEQERELDENNNH